MATGPESSAISTSNYLAQEGGLVASNEGLLNAQINIARKLELGILTSINDRTISHKFFVAALNARDAQWKTVTLIKKSMSMSQQVLETSIPRILDCFNRGKQDLSMHYLEQTLVWTKEMADETKDIKWYNDVFTKMTEVNNMMGDENKRKADQLIYLETGEQERLQGLIDINKLDLRSLRDSRTSSSVWERISKFFTSTKQQNAEAEQRENDIKEVQSTINNYREELATVVQECKRMNGREDEFEKGAIESIQKAHEYLDNIHEFFSNMVTFFSAQLMKGQTASLAIPDADAFDFLNQDMTVLRERWLSFMQACKQYIIHCDGAGEYSTKSLFDFMDGRLEKMTKEDRSEKMENLKMSAQPVPFLTEGPK